MDLCVRHYLIPKGFGNYQSFIVIYLGGCKLMGEIVQKLTQKSWQVGGFETALRNLKSGRNEMKLNELKFEVYQPPSSV